VITAHLAAAWSERSQEVEDHLHHLIGNDAQHVERMVQLWSTYTVALAGTVTLSIAAVLIAPIPAVIGGLAFFFVVLLIRPMSKSVKKTAMGFQSSNRGLMTNVAQVARLDKEIAAFEVGGAVRESLLKEVVSSSKLLERLRFTQRLTPVLYLDASFALVIAGIAVLSAMDVRSVNFLGPLVLLMVRALGYARQLQTSTQSSFEYVPYLVALEREITAFESAIRPVGSSPIDEIGAIEFINMSFSYIPNHAILTDVNLTIDFGEIVGLVGQSGAGKTTLSEILLGLRQPTSGQLRVTGVELAEVSPTQWASLVAYVPQDNSLIRATVAENIAFFRSGFDYADIERSAKAARLHDEIMLMPQGYDTMVGPGERSLSGGQCQRLGIARALLGKPQLLVLDEPTSALDERSESLIKKTLIELKGTATMIVVAHRPTTLAVCTRVLRLADGVLTEISNTGR
jgi:ABC-type multidrug transport system fused ATPase/permease subunit